MQSDRKLLPNFKIHNAKSTIIGNNGLKTKTFAAITLFNSLNKIRYNKIYTISYVLMIIICIPTTRTLVTKTRDVLYYTLVALYFLSPYTFRVFFLYAKKKFGSNAKSRSIKTSNVTHIYLRFNMHARINKTNSARCYKYTCRRIRILYDTISKSTTILGIRPAEGHTTIYQNIRTEVVNDRRGI